MLSIVRASIVALFFLILCLFVLSAHAQTYCTPVEDHATDPWAGHPELQFHRDCDDPSENRVGAEAPGCGPKRVVCITPDMKQHFGTISPEGVITFDVKPGQPL